MAAELRQHEVKVRFSEAEHACALAWAGSEPLAVKLRRSALGEAPKRKPRKQEPPVHPLAAELVRAVAAATNQLRPLPIAGIAVSELAPAQAEALRHSLDRIEAQLRQVLELAR